MATPERKPNPLFLTLIAAGLFLIGAALLPLLLEARQAALAPAGNARIPSASSYPAPQLVLTDLQGDPADLADTRGQLVLVNNWATWCPPCKAEMPALQAYYERHRGEGLVIVAIESGSSPGQVAEFAASYGLTFTVWIDPAGAALDAFRNWNLPSTYVIDRSGTVILSWTGEINLASLEQYVTPLLDR